MFTFLKRYFCQHLGINTITEMNHGQGLIIAKTKIYCQDCNKSFEQHPMSQCCYVQHIHAEILKEQFMQQYMKVK